MSSLPELLPGHSEIYQGLGPYGPCVATPLFVGWK